MVEAAVRLGKGCVVQDNVILGLKYREGSGAAIIGDRAIIRWGTVVYGDVVAGDDFVTGHFALIREQTTLGNQVLVGSGSILDGHIQVGHRVKIEGAVYIPTHTQIGNEVFIGPHAVLTNDRYPLRMRDLYAPQGPTIEDSVTIGANATVLPGVRIGAGAFIAAGAVVTKDVPPWTLAMGVPAKIYDLPENLRERNRALTW